MLRVQLAKLTGYAAPALRTISTGGWHQMPELYESELKDRSPCPSPAPGVTKNQEGQQESLPDNCYPIQHDPSTKTQHPGEAEKQETQQHPKLHTEELTSDTKATASAGDPSRPVEQAKRQSGQQ